jgi:hypothetical protein
MAVMAVSYQEKEYDLNGVNYLVEVEVYGNLVDDSFSHEFGTEYLTSIEIDSVEIMTVYDHEGNVITSRTIIKQLENIVDADDFDDVDFSE